MALQQLKFFIGLNLIGMLLLTAASGQSGIGQRPDAQLPATGERAETAEPNDQVDPEIHEFIKQGGGVHEVTLKSGKKAVLAVSSAAYITKSQNKQLILKGQRTAALTAATKARQALVTYFGGLQIEGRTKLLESMQTSDTVDTSSTKMQENQLEVIRNSNQGLLRGAVIYSLDDDPQANKVVVAVIVTARSLTIGSGSHFASPSAQSDDQQAVDSIKQEVALGKLFPTGARCISIPSKNGAVWVGYGSAIIWTSPDDDPRIVEAVKNAGERTAKQQANKMLTTAMYGETIANQETSMEESSSDLQENSATGFSEIIAKESNEASSRQKLQAEFQGKVPPRVEYFQEKSKDGNWTYCVAIYRQIDPAPQEAGAKVKQAGPTQSRESDSTSTVAPVLQAPQLKQGECGTSSDPAYINVIANGINVERRVAIKTALVEALEKSNGLAIKSSSVIREIYRDAVKDVNGKIDRLVEAENTNREDISTETNGLIAGFEILSESRDADKKFVVQLCVRVPVFDPSRPRPGRRISIAIMPFKSARETFMVAGQPQGLHVTQVQTEIISELSRLLSANGDVCVIERQYLAELDGEMAHMKQEVESGRMDQGEMVKFGRKIGVDYLIVGNIAGLEYSESKVYNRVRQAEEPRAYLHIKSSARLVNVATTAQVAADNFEQNWDLMSLLGLQPNEAALSKWTFAAQCAIKSHFQQIAKGLKAAMALSTCRVLKMVSETEAVLEYAGPPIEKGTILKVYKIEETVSPFTNKVHKLETLKGTVRVLMTAQEKEQVYVEVVNISRPLELGDECRR